MISPKLAPDLFPGIASSGAAWSKCAVIILADSRRLSTDLVVSGGLFCNF